MQREIEKRVVWASYAADVFTTAGVEKNSFWRGELPQMALPYDNQDFLAQTASQVSCSLRHIETPESMSVASHLDLPALVVVLLKSRSQILRLATSYDS